MPAQGSQAERGDRIGDCYRIEGELGQGGMARVYRVVDERSGQALALKQLVSEGERHATLQAMFEREYHTLAQLSHPCIVRVFDYGLHHDLPYYTMELLEGTDVRRALRGQSLGVRQICMLLRDAASALALIHSRRLVHRDVSPRNLWCTPDGRAKLIDFGTLVAMGPQSRAAGTAPFVPPEAVYMQPLDGRCDLYALGALAYYLLTRHNAYPAHEIGELRQVWRRRPKRPDAIMPEISRPLSDLVMALLSLDARGRPASAAEVVERLTAIAELPEEDDRHLAQAFLTSPTLVGRAAASAFLRKRLQRARRGHYQTVAIVAPAGCGRSRMLESCVLEAKLTGAVAVVVDAAAAGPDAFALAALIAERLLEAMPLLAADVIDVAGVLAHLSPALRRALGGPALAVLAPAEGAAKISSAFVALIAAASRHQHVLIAVDDVHRADSASIAALARLSALTAARLLLVTTCDQSAIGHHAPPFDQLLKPQDRVALAPLAAEDTRALLGSLFDEVPELDAVASWLHELSQGSPQTCMQYAQYLVDHGLARYEDGRWRLPQQLRDQALPETLGAMLEGRLAVLSDDARALALGLALARDDSRAVWQPEKHVDIEDFPRLLDDAVTGRDVRGTSHAARAFGALDELLRAGIVQQRDSRYVLGQRAVVDVLLRISDEEVRRAMHRRLAGTFASAGQVNVTMVRHLQRAGEHLRARELIQSIADRLGGSDATDWGAIRVPVAEECAQVAYAHWQAHGGSPREGILLRRLLLLTCSVYNWRNARFADAQLAQLRADCGLVHLDAIDASRPPLERVIEVLKRAQQEYDAKPEHARGFAPGDAVRELAACALSVFGAFASTFDVVSARRLPEVLAPLRPLSPAIALIIDLASIGIDRAAGGELGDRLLECAARAEHEAGLSDLLRQSGSTLARYSQALADARQGRARALELAEQLMPGVEQHILGVHVRWISHAFRGRADLAAPYFKQMETAGAEDVWRRRATLFIESELLALSGDLSGLERTGEAIAALAEDFPGWHPWLSWTRGVIHRLRGELPAAQAEFEAGLALATAGEHRAWVSLAPALAEVLLLRGDAEAALRHALAVVEAVEARSLNRNAAVAAERVRALAESSRRDHAAAEASIARAFAIARELGFDGLPLAHLHEAHARVLLAAGDDRAGAGALAALHDLIEHADAPALIHAYEALRAESSHAPTLDLSAGAQATQHMSSTEYSQLWTDVYSSIAAYDQRSTRAQHALTLLIEDSGARGGHLLLLDAAGLFIAASSASSVASDRVLLAAQRHIDAELSRTSSDAAVTTSAPSASRSSRPRAGASAELSPLLLAADADGQSTVTGVVLLVPNASSPRMPRSALVQVISRCLELAGDSIAQPLRGTQP